MSVDRGLALPGMQVSDKNPKGEGRAGTLVCNSFSVQDWKEKYIHRNYTQIFTENFTEEVRQSGFRFSAHANPHSCSSHMGLLSGAPRDGPGCV